jgi:predicted nucleic acid-binding protein
MDAYDADVLIYAASSDPRGRPVRRTLEATVGVGSVVLIPELLSRPLRDGDADEVAALEALLSRLTLIEADGPTARLAAAFGATYGLRAADALHLATAVAAGADRFITSNRRDFGQEIAEIAVVDPEGLA